MDGERTRLEQEKHLGNGAFKQGDFAAALQVTHSKSHLVLFLDALWRPSSMLRRREERPVSWHSG